MPENEELTPAQRRRLILFGLTIFLLVLVGLGLRGCVRLLPAVIAPKPTPTADFPSPATVAAHLTQTPGATAVSATPTNNLPTPTPIAGNVISGASILYILNHDLWRSDLNGARVERLTSGKMVGVWNLDLQGEVEPWWAGGLSPQIHVSPDGRWLVFTQTGKNLVIVDVTGREPVRTLSPGGVRFAWSPDSRTLAFNAVPGGLTLYDLQMDEMRPLVRQRVWEEVWSPDGRSIGYACCFSQEADETGLSPGLIKQYNLASGIVETVGETWRGIASGPPRLCWLADGRLLPEDEADGPLVCSYHRPIPASLSPDGRQQANLSLRHPDDTEYFRLLQITNAADGRLLWEKELDVTVDRVAWSPDGKHILLGTGWSDGPILRGRTDGTSDFFTIIPSAKFLDVIPQGQTRQQLCPDASPSQICHHFQP